LSDIIASFSIEYLICNPMEPLRESRHISISKIKNIARRSVTIINFFGCFWDISHSIETIPWKYHDIIIGQKSSLLYKSIFEDRMTNSLRENRTPKCDHPTCESELSWVKTSLTEKPWYEICVERLGHQCHESLPSSAVEKCIMKDGDLRVFPSWGVRKAGGGSFLFFFHAKRILN